MYNQIFKYESYKQYLNEVLLRKRGEKSRLAEFLGCQSGFISHVLKREVHVSLDQAVKVNQFLHHTEEEAHFFLLLVHRERAGSKDLKNYYGRQIKKLQEQVRDFSKRVETTRTVNKNDESEYFSSWVYAAIQVLATIPRWQDVNSLSLHLGIPLQRLWHYLDFLKNLQLLNISSNKISAGQTRIHLQKKSHNVVKHHLNWRIKSLQEIEKNLEGNQHYSGVFAASPSDIEKIKMLFLENMSKVESIIEKSQGSEAIVIQSDVYRL